MPDRVTSHRIGEVHYEVACLHALGHLHCLGNDIAGGKHGGCDASDETQQGSIVCDAFSCLFHLCHASSLGIASAAYTVGRLLTGVGSSLSPLLSESKLVTEDAALAVSYLSRAVRCAQLSPEVREAAAMDPDASGAAAGLLLISLLQPRDKEYGELSNDAEARQAGGESELRSTFIHRHLALLDGRQGLYESVLRLLTSTRESLGDDLLSEYSDVVNGDGGRPRPLDGRLRFTSSWHANGDAVETEADEWLPSSHSTHTQGESPSPRGESPSTPSRRRRRRCHQGITLPVDEDTEAIEEYKVREELAELLAAQGHYARATAEMTAASEAASESGRFKAGVRLAERAAVLEGEEAEWGEAVGG